MVVFMIKKTKEKKYIENRKKLLKTYQELIVERHELNKKIRDVNSEMKQWDKYLLAEV